MLKEAPIYRATAAATRGYGLALIGTVSWSTTAPIIAYLLASSTLAPLMLASWRDLFAALILGAVLAVRAPARLRLARKDWLFILVYGASLAAMNAAWTVSVARNGAAVSTVLVYTAPAFLTLTAAPF